MPRPRTATQREAAHAAALQAGIPADYHDRAIVLAQVIYLLNQHRRIQNAIAFKGGAVMQHVDASPRYSRDIDAAVISAPLTSSKTIRTQWVQEALTSEEARKVVMRVEPEPFIANKTLRAPIIKCHTVAGPPPVTIAFSVTWREPLLRKPVIATFSQPIDGSQFSVPVLHPAERCAEKIRAFLMRQLCRDAFDLYYYQSVTLAGADRRALPDLVLDKLSLRDKESDPAAHTPLLELWDDACAAAATSWPGPDLILSGNQVGWTMVKQQLDALRRLLHGLRVPPRGSRDLTTW